MNFPPRQTSYVARFRCLGETCPDTCCQGWGMQVDESTFEKYKREAPELVPAVVAGESAHVMRRDAETDLCVKLEAGLCAIHKNYGTDFLGDACHFYPRITRQAEDRTVMTAALSCPEIARLVLFEDAPFGWADLSIARAPELMRRYRAEGLDGDGMIAVHDAFLAAAGDENAPPERVLARLISILPSLAMQPEKDWAAAVPFYYAHADARLPETEFSDADPFHLLHTLAGLLHAARRSPRTRLRAVMETIGQSLDARVDPDTLQLVIAPDSMERYARLSAFWYANAALPMVPVLRRYLQAQFSMSFFPFSGLGASLAERIAIIVVRFATAKLALMALADRLQAIPDAAQCIETLQPLSRFLDHLAEPELSLAMYKEAGWLKTERLRGLLEDA